MIRNIVGAPVRGKDFFDREEIVDLVWSRLETNNILLAAPRRFGKTSIMYRLLDNPRPGWRPIHVDAESIRDPSNFIIALLDAALADQRLRQFLLKKWKTAGSWLRKLLGEIDVQTPWDVELKLKFKEAIGQDWQERGEVLLKTLRDYDDRERLLFLIDELPVMLALFEDSDIDDAVIRAFLYWFRRLRTDPAVGLSNCRFLIGGSIGIEHALSRMSATAAFNDFERLALRELSASRAAEFLRLLLRTSKVTLSDKTQQAMLELIGTPIPYFLQVFVAEIANATASGEKRIGPTGVEALYRDRVLGVTNKSYFQHYFERLRYYEKPAERAAKAILKELAVNRSEAVPRAGLRALYRQEVGEPASEDGFNDLLWNLENDF